ncbi:hypothetical protein HAX54_044964, partial [Datura stramonium]|nr:hypothetical protein [Datura stramonium]
SKSWVGRCWLSASENYKLGSGLRTRLGAIGYRGTAAAGERSHEVLELEAIFPKSGGIPLPK